MTKIQSLIVFLVVLWNCANCYTSVFEGETWMAGDVFINNGDDSLFYYLFKARNVTNRGKKLIIWLSGGPGCSSMAGLLMENGPYVLNKDLQIIKNIYSWNTDYDIVFVDQPVGTGYALVKDNSHYCRNETCVAKNFYQFLLAFVTEYYPEYEGKEIYITGESYGGHYIPAITEYILRINHPSIRVRAIAIGNGLIDMPLQINAYPLYIYENNLVYIIKYVLTKFISSICYVGSFFRSSFTDTLCIDGMSIIAVLADIKNPYNINKTNNDTAAMEKARKFMNNSIVQAACGIKNHRNIEDVCDKKVNQLMGDDICTSLTGSIGYILNKGLRVLLYHGDLDYICNWRGGELVADAIPWKGREAYKKQTYKSFPSKTEDGSKKGIGAFKKEKNFIYMRVYNAGHMVPTDQSKAALEMLRAFIDDKIQ